MNKQNQKGFTLLEIMIVVMIIGLLATLALPSFQKSRDEARKKICLNNRRNIEFGKEMLAMDQDLSGGDPVDVADVNEYIKGMRGQSEELGCPSQGAIAYQAINFAPTCTVHAPAAPAQAASPPSGPQGGPQTGTENQNGRRRR